MLCVNYTPIQMARYAIFILSESYFKENTDRLLRHQVRGNLLLKFLKQCVLLLVLETEIWEHICE